MNNSAAEQHDDIGADLKAAMTELTSSGEGSAPGNGAPSTGAPASAAPGRANETGAPDSNVPATDADLKAAPTVGERPRAPDGKFAKAEGEAPASGQQPKQEVAPKTGPLLPIAHWSQEIKAEFEGLPDEAKSLILKRERERDAAFTRKSQEFAQMRDNYASLAKAVEPHIQRLRLNGVQPAQAIEQLFAIEAFANQDPVNFIKQFAQQRGVDLAQVVQPANSGEYVDPQLQQIREEIARERQSRERLEQEYQRRFQESQMAVQTERDNATSSVIVSFMNEQSADGSPAHPYFEYVQQDMQELLPIILKRMPNASPRERLQAAYDQAVWANPTTRADLQKQSVQRQADDMRATAEQARARAASVTGSPGYGGSVVEQPAQAPAATIEEELKRAWDAQVARGRI